MSKAEKTIDGILSRLFITAYKIEEKATAKESGRRLSISELHVIREIGTGRLKSMSQVARGLKISVGALTTAINKLEDKGYVQRRRNDQDKRIVNIELTKRGERAYERHDSFHKDMIGAALEGLTHEERAILLKSLKKLDRHFGEEWLNNHG